MSESRYKVFTAAEVQQFVERGYVMLRGAFDADTAAAVRQLVWDRIEPDPDDSSTWTEATLHVRESLSGPAVARAFTPRLIAGFDDLMGRGRREQREPALGWWPVTFPGFHDPPWTTPTNGWHVDGIQFHHHVHSRDQGLLPIFLLSDIDPGDGGTAIVPGSHRRVARLLADHEPDGMEVGELCRAARPIVDELWDDVVETTGRPGDVAMLHPFMIHSASANTGRRVRFICNPCQVLEQDMNLHRDSADDYSAVERAIVEALEEAAPR